MSIHKIKRDKNNDNFVIYNKYIGFSIFRELKLFVKRLEFMQNIFGFHNKDNTMKLVSTTGIKFKLDT